LAIHAAQKVAILLHVLEFCFPSMMDAQVQFRWHNTKGITSKTTLTWFSFSVHFATMASTSSCMYLMGNKKSAQGQAKYMQLHDWSMAK